MNEVHVAGVIKACWTYDARLYVRVSLRRSRERPQRSPRAGGSFDYMTVVFPGDAQLLTVMQPGMYLTVHGWLQSRDFDESLRQFMLRVEGATPPEIDEDFASALIVHRSISEIVAERWSLRSQARRSYSAGAQT